MSKELKVGQKLYHFAYGPLTIIGVSSNYVDTVADFPTGYRGGNGVGQSSQCWLIETVGHWLFENESQVGTENNNFDWKKIWSSYNHAPVLPVADAKDTNNWHTYYTKGVGLKKQEVSPVGIAGAEVISPVGIAGTNPDGDVSPVGIVRK